MQWIIRFILVLVLGATSLTAQLRLYGQRKLISQTGRVQNQCIQLDTATLLGYITNYSLLTINVDSGTSALVDYAPVGVQTANWNERINGRILGFARTIGGIMYVIDGSLPPKPLETFESLSNISTLKPNWAEDGPICFMTFSGDSIYISRDAGVSFQMVPTEGSFRYFFHGMILLYKQHTNGEYYEFMIDNSHTSLRLTPMGREIEFAAFGKDSTLYWIQSRFSGPDVKLYHGRVGDTLAVQIDSVRTTSRSDTARPLAVFRMASGVVLYLDRSGLSYRLGTDSAEALPFAFGSSDAERYAVSQARGGFTYMVAVRQSGQTMYRIELTDPPTVDSMSVPAGVITQLDPFSADIRGMGQLMHASEVHEYLFRPQHQQVIATGSLVKEMEVLPWREMLYAWHAPDGALMVVSNLEQVLEVDEYGRGLVRRGTVHHPDNLRYDFNTQMCFPSRNQRELIWSCKNRHFMMTVLVV